MKKLLIPLFIFALILPLIRCTNNPASVSSTETTSGSVTGKLVSPDGRPVKDARVQLFDVRYVPSYGAVTGKIRKTANRDTVVATDSNGKYRLPVPDSGVYNIYGETDDGLAVLIDSVVVEDTIGIAVKTDTLRSPGQLHGISFMPGQSDTNQLRITIYIPGTKFFTKPTIGGYFSFSKIPQGRYQVIFDPTLPDYFVKIIDTAVQSGTALDLDTVIIYSRTLPGTPQAFAGNDTTVSIRDTVRLHGTATDTLGAIISREWDIGNTGGFRAGSGDTAIVAPSVPDTVIPCIFRVTDNDRNIRQDTVLISVVRGLPVVSAGRDTAVQINSPFTLTGTAADQWGYITQFAWDFNQDGVFEDSLPANGTVQKMIFTREKNTVVFRARDDDGFYGYDTINVYGGTMVPGPRIFSNTVLAKAASPFITLASLYVEQGAVLTLEAGASLFFVDSGSLVVNGTLRAVGSAADSITFSSLRPGPRPGDWGGIVFRDSSADTSCLLQYCIVEFAENGVFCRDASPGIRQSSIRYNRNGIAGEGSAAPQVSGNVIVNNLRRGITDCFGVIENNTFTSNDTAVYNPGSVTGNVITFNTCGLYSTGAPAYSIINNNLISENRTAGLCLAGGDHCNIYNNTIVKNGQAGIFLGVFYTGLVAFNVIADNPVGIETDTSIHLSFPFMVTRNNFSNTAYNLKYFGESALDAADNYWGTVNDSVIAESIYDYYDTVGLGKVQYLPFAVEPIPTAGRP